MAYRAPTDSCQPAEVYTQDHPIFQEALRSRPCWLHCREQQQLLSPWFNTHTILTNDKQLSLHCQRSQKTLRKPCSPSSNPSTNLCILLWLCHNGGMTFLSWHWRACILEHYWRVPIAPAQFTLKCKVCILCAQKDNKQEKRISPGNIKDLGMACHTPPLQYVSSETAKWDGAEDG